MNNAKQPDKVYLIHLSRAALLISLLYCGHSDAAVTGTCANCHTMHDSQDGGPIAISGTGVGWDGSGQLAGGTLQGPMDQLLVTDCIGCHSSTTTSTIINVGASRIPIVFNTADPPTNPLAGGNFYWVAQASLFGDAYGHNVYGISGTDGALSEAPGSQSSTCGGNSCHVSLALDPLANSLDKNGCQGCHFSTAHHDDSKPWYRFLTGHRSVDHYVTGIEDPDWEQDPATGHNMYQGYDGPVPDDNTELDNTNSISSFCGGCHGIFHKIEITSGAGPGSTIGIGTASPWLRHPTDVTIYDKGGEYTGYDTIGSYSAEAPVAWVDPSSPSLGTAVVMCLSCHRPHGSDQPDMLRWDYNDMIVGSGNSGGCFTCHTTKN